MDDRSSVGELRDLDDFVEDGDPGRDGELEAHCLRARLTNLPDTARALEGRATGSGGLVSGTVMSVSCDSRVGASSCFCSPDDPDLRGLPMALFWERREARRRISLPAATSSFVGDGARWGEVKSENVLRSGGETVVLVASGRFW